MIKFTIPLAPITKKNHSRIVYAGGRPVVIPSKQYQEYERSCGIYLDPLNIDYKINLKTVFYMPTRRRTDITNLMSAIHDILTKYHVIFDDNSSIVCSVDGSRVKYDKFNPRTEIEITEYNDKEV